MPMLCEAHLRRAALLTGRESKLAPQTRCGSSGYQLSFPMLSSLVLPCERSWHAQLTPARGPAALDAVGVSMTLLGVRRWMSAAHSCNSIWGNEQRLPVYRFMKKDQPVSENK